MRPPRVSCSQRALSTAVLVVPRYYLDREYPHYLCPDITWIDSTRIICAPILLGLRTAKEVRIMRPPVLERHRPRPCSCSRRASPGLVGLSAAVLPVPRYLLGLRVAKKSLQIMRPSMRRRHAPRPCSCSLRACPGLLGLSAAVLLVPRHLLGFRAEYKSLQMIHPSMLRRHARTPCSCSLRASPPCYCCPDT